MVLKISTDMDGSSPPPPSAWSAAAKRWLESYVGLNNAGSPAAAGELLRSGSFGLLCMSDLVVSLADAGRALCTFTVPGHVADADGNWDPGAIAAVIDAVGMAAIMTTEGIVKVSVDFDISFFAPARINEEVEIDARVVAHKGEKLTMVAVEVRKKGSEELVAQGRQWMSSSQPKKSKL